MSEEIVSPARKRIAYKVLHVWPLQQCFYCPRLTHVAIVDYAFTANFTPVCPLHGYPQHSGDDEDPQDLAGARIESICRYVIWMHADMGRVVLVSRLERPEDIPGYELDEEIGSDDIAWHTRYEAVSGERIDVWVVWSLNYGQFFLYEASHRVSRRMVEEVI